MKTLLKQEGKHSRDILITTDTTDTVCNMCGKTNKGIRIDLSDGEYSTLKLCTFCMSSIIDDIDKIT